MVKVSIVFSDGKIWTPWGWGIKKYLGTPYDHTCFYIERYNENWESVSTGVRVMTRQKWLDDHIVIEEFSLYLSDERVEEIRANAKSELGIGYGFFQYITIILNLSKDNGLYKLICSEFVSRLFAKELGYPPETNFDKITPKDLYKCIKETL